MQKKQKEVIKLQDQQEEATKLQNFIGWVIAIILIMVILYAGFFALSRVFSFVVGSDDTPEYSQREIKEKMEAHLYERYGEKFVVNRIGRRRFGDTPFYQGRIYPERFVGTEKHRDEYYQAEVNIDILESGELRDPGDTYGRVIARKEAKEFLRPVAQELFGERIRLKPEISYNTRNSYGTMQGYLTSDFKGALSKSVNDPENHRLEFDLNLYVFDRIENEEEKEQRREDIFEFIQYLKEEGLYEYLELGIIFIDERVLVNSFNEINRRIDISKKVTKEINGDTIQMPPKDLQKEVTNELQREFNETSEKELLSNMKKIRKDELNYEDIRQYYGQYYTWIYSLGMLEERYSSSITEEDKKRTHDVIEDIELKKYESYIFED